jgi:hypothetical protein
MVCKKCNKNNVKFRITTWYMEATSCRQLGSLMLLLPMLKGTFCLERVSPDFGGSFGENACILNHKQNMYHVNTPTRAVLISQIISQIRTAIPDNEHQLN